MTQYIKRFAGCCIGILLTLWLAAQPNLSRIEYYLDIDPGFGRGTAISFPAGNNASDIALNINPATLSEGIHILGIRALDADGVWSPDNKWLFLKPSAASGASVPNLNRVEYYMDTDPGYGRGTAISFTAGTNISNKTFNIDPTTLSEGVHFIGIRARDANGGWSQDNTWLFLKPSVIDNGIVPNISRVEYYMDNDPGYGRATSVSFTPGTNLSDLSINLDPSLVAEGVHVFGIRAKDANGKWSHDNKWLFLKPFASDALPVPALSNVEYYIDTDPGYGNGVPVAINTPLNLQNFNLNINVSGLSAGNHKLFIRAKDAYGKWSYDYRYVFSVSPIIAAPSIVVNSITSKTLCAKDAVKISYHATGTYNVGNVFAAELSDASGNFASPTVIGTYTGTGNVIINATLPTHVTDGSLYRVRVSSSDPVVTGITGDDTLVIHDAPYAQTITGDASVNAGATYPYSVPTVVGSSWNWLSGTATITPTNNAASVVWNVAGNSRSLKIVETNSFGCKGDTSIKLVNVYTLIIDSVKVSTLKPCPSSAITVTAKVSGVYAPGNVFTAQLSNATGSFTTPKNIGSVTVSPLGNLQLISISATMPYPLGNGAGYRIRVIANSPAVISSDNGQNITVSKPNLGADQTAGYCPGSFVNLTSIFTTSGLISSWNTARPDSITTNGNYRLIVTNTNGCKDTAFVNVSMFAKPFVGNDTTFTICGGTTYDLTTLYNTSSFISVVWNIPNPQSASGGNYTLIVTNTNGCKDTALVTINELQVLNPAISPADPIAICSGDSVMLSITGGPFNTYSWSNGLLTPTIVAKTAGAYSVTVTNSFGCSKTSSVVNLTVNALPAVPKITATPKVTLNLCPGTTATLTSSSVTGNLWSTGAVTRNISVSASGSYTVKVTNSNGCSATSAIKKVTFVCSKPLVVGTNTITGNSAIVVWRLVPCAVSYTLQYRKVGTSSYTTVSVADTSFAITGLSVATNYEWKVRSVCIVSPLSASSYTALSNFMTANSVAPKSLPDDLLVNDLDAFDATLFPNPTNKNAMLQIKGNNIQKSKYSISIKDVTGKVLWQAMNQSGNNISLPVENMASGIYFISISNKIRVKTVRLIKQ